MRAVNVASMLITVIIFTIFMIAWVLMPFKSFKLFSTGDFLAFCVSVLFASTGMVTIILIIAKWLRGGK